MKRGPDGAVCGEAGGDILALPTQPIANANTVGAGDTFNAGLLHALAQGSALQDAVASAIRLATAAVMHGKGVLGALPEGADHRAVPGAKRDRKND